MSNHFSGLLSRLQQSIYLHSFHHFYGRSGKLIVYQDHVPTDSIGRDDVTSVYELADVIRKRFLCSIGNPDFPLSNMQ